jgi:NAD(P)-dependent dehydrogenase (short-subunit alcohol dehydrogenase family)
LYKKHDTAIGKQKGRRSRRDFRYWPGIGKTVGCGESRGDKPLRVNAVSPGVIDTPWWDFMPAADKDQVFSGFSSQVCVGRVGRPEEVASAIRFILENEYINGVIIGCHGGL